MRMRYAPRALAGGFVTAAALLVVACGSSALGLLSSEQAGALNAALDRVNAKLNHHHCVAAQNQAANFRRSIAQLPGSVSPTVRRSLDQGALTIEQYVAQDCVEQPAPAPPPPAATPTTSTHTAPSPPPKKTGTTTNPNATPPPNAGTKAKGHGHGPKPHGGD
jgi:hypothetical protein